MSANKKHIYFSLLALIFIICTLIALIIFSDEQYAMKEQYRKEFNDAYFEQIDVTGNIVEYELVASNGEVELYDGVKTKVWNYNGSVPGPELRVTLGDTIRVNFTNNLDEPTTIHWHGVRLDNSMDGVPGITQELIQPGETFVYEFTPKDAGTFWFHPHENASKQLERGLYGILIVEDQVEYAYSQDVTWVIDDWLIQDDYQVYPSFVTMHDLAHDGRWGNVITVNGKLKENLVVAPGERIRLRLINTSNGRVYRPDFGNLEAKVIAVDGMYVKEVFDASGFELAPGNRIDVDITIPKDATGFGYTVTDNYTGYLNVLASFEVSGEPTDINNFSYPTNSRIPDWDEVEKSMVDVEYKLDAKSSGGMMMGNLNWTINNEIYPDVEPYALSYNEFSVIKFKNMSPRLHPMHIHGMFFKVLYRDGKKVNEPYFRDTVLINPEESVIVGMVPMDKGLWLNHCHIQEHAEAGMMTIIEVK